MNSTPTLLQRAERVGKALEDALLVLILSGMILLAAGQILLRNAFDFGFIWSDELLRLMVLWIALAGAVAASRSDKQINIAVLDRFLPRVPAVLVKIIVHLFSLAVCAVVTWVSIQFVQASRAYEDVILGNVPAWTLQLILPVGFALMTWRYTVLAIKSLASLFQPPAES